MFENTEAKCQLKFQYILLTILYLTARCILKMFAFDIFKTGERAPWLKFVVQRREEVNIVVKVVYIT